MRVMALLCLSICMVALTGNLVGCKGAEQSAAAPGALKKAQHANQKMAARVFLNQLMEKSDGDRAAFAAEHKAEVDYINSGEDENLLIAYAGAMHIPLNR